MKYIVQVLENNQLIKREVLDARSSYNAAIDAGYAGPMRGIPRPANTTGAYFQYGNLIYQVDMASQHDPGQL